ncbi:MAG: sigma-54-dependent Fis family transcriptional regulator [Candidatus Eisenbacteria bacterium]|nr:sigma-54-dependent Fis family transcriptional regulator [Candidatus Eisenbacteria bacterium]
MVSRDDVVRVLVVDDEMVVRESLAAWFREEGCEVGTADGGNAALEQLGANDWDVYLLDVKMPGMDGIELQRRVLEHRPDATIIVMTAYASVDTAVQAMKAGAHDYLSKPFDPTDLSRIVRVATERHRLLRENRRLRESVEETTALVDVVGNSPAMNRVMSLVEQVAPTDATVLLRGESGTGKEVVARAIHTRSARRFLPIIVVNCGALPDGVLESELFGHERGAFTGAQYRRKGRIELADGGTLFLDEIGDVSPKTQLDLLRVLEEKTITRIGSNRSTAVDFRTLAATNRDLEDLVRKGTFREDLYYRLNVFSITIPPLRDRPEDIQPLVEHFLRKFSRAMNRPVRKLSQSALRGLLAYPWPGNVRELQNAVERALVVARGELIEVDDFPFSRPVHEATNGNSVPKGSDALTAAADAAGRSLSSIEEEHIRRVLEDTHYNISLAARVLEIDRVTLYNKMRRYGIHRPGTPSLQST